MTLTHAQRRARRAEIAECVRNGMHPLDAARQFGVSTNTVNTAIHEHSGGGRAALSRAQRRLRREQIAQRIRAGATLQDVSAEFGVSLSTARKCSGKTMRPITSRSLTLIADLINTAEPAKSLAVKHECSDVWVYKLLKRARQAGIRFPLRSGEEAPSA